MPGTETTTATAGGAGAALGSLLGAGLAAVTGLSPELCMGSLATVGAFAFGRIFGS